MIADSLLITCLLQLKPNRAAYRKSKVLGTEFRSTRVERMNYALFVEIQAVLFPS